MYLRVMKNEPLAQTYIKDGELSAAPSSRPDVDGLDLLSLESVFSLAALESKLVAYINDPSAAEVAFDVSTVPKVSRAQAQQESARKWWLRALRGVHRALTDL